MESLDKIFLRFVKGRLNIYNILSTLTKQKKQITY